MADHKTETFRLSYRFDEIQNDQNIKLFVSICFILRENKLELDKK